MWEDAFLAQNHEYIYPCLKKGDKMKLNTLIIIQISQVSLREEIKLV